MIPNADATQDKVYRILSGNIEALDAIETVLRRANRTILVFDLSLHDRGFNSPQRTDLLRHFLLADRANAIRIALHDPDSLERDCPRLLNLLREHPVSIHIHRCTGVALQASDPFIVADNAYFWRQPHYQHPRSVLSLGSALDTKPLIERFEEIWESSEVAVSASTTGL